MAGHQHDRLLALLLLAGCCMVQTCAGTPTMTIGIGKCPEKTVVQNFTVERFMGLWYETSRTLPMLELGGKCPRVQYSLDNDNGEVSATYSIINPLTQNEHRTSGKAVPSNPKADPPNGRYLATVDVNMYFLFNVPITVPFLIVDTDYDNYAIVYSCFSVGDFFYGGGVVILSRKPTVSTDSQLKIDATLRREGFDSLGFLKTDQTCVLV